MSLLQWVATARMPRWARQAAAMNPSPHPRSSYQKSIVMCHRKAKHQPCCRDVQGRQQQATHFTIRHAAGISTCVTVVTSCGAHLCQRGSSDWLPPEL